MVHAPKHGYAVGLMSGTSADGIDAALMALANRTDCEFPDIQFVDFLYLPFTPSQRASIFALFSPDARIVDVGQAHVQLGHCFAEAVEQLLNKSGLSRGDVVVIGSHGQTIAHYPLGMSGDGQNGFTLQLGDPAVIAERTGIDVVSDFRARDVAAGGQGAPLVPYFDYAVFHASTEHRVLLNIGGIANVTMMPRGGSQEDCIGFDTGPGNMVIDAAVEQLSNGKLHFDEDGRWASNGTVIEPLLDTWLEHPYFRAAPPKSTGREDFGQAYTHTLISAAITHGTASADILRTLTAFVARTISDGIQSALAHPFTLIASGGGCRNRLLMNDLSQMMQPQLNRRWQSTDDYGVPSDAKEAMAFAYLGWQFIHGRWTNMPVITGANTGVFWEPGNLADTAGGNLCEWIPMGKLGTDRK